MSEVKDTGFDLLATIGNHIRPEFESKDTDWSDSPFEWVKTLPAASKGKFGTRLIAAWSAANGLKIDSSPDSDADLLINGHRTEIKFSTLLPVRVSL